jgi:hypothetical protein
MSGEGKPVMLPGIMDSLLEDSLETSDKSGAITIIDGWADADIAITLLLIGIPTYTNNRASPGVNR